MKFINFIVILALLQQTLVNADYDSDRTPDGTNRTLYSFHFLGINGVDKASTVGYVQTYNGVEYYAYNGNSLCVLTATNSSGSITKFTASNDFGKCPDFANGTLTELDSQADGTFKNSNNNDIWHLTWFDISSSSSINMMDARGERTCDTYSMGYDCLNKHQYWKMDGTCSYHDSEQNIYYNSEYHESTIREASQTWGPMSYVMYNKNISATCYLIKADPLDKGTPSGSFDDSQRDSLYAWDQRDTCCGSSMGCYVGGCMPFVKSWYVVDAFPGSCSYFDDGWTGFEVQGWSGGQCTSSLGLASSSSPCDTYEGYYIRRSSNGPHGGMNAMVPDFYFDCKQKCRGGCGATYQQLAVISVVIALISLIY